MAQSKKKWYVFVKEAEACGGGGQGADLSADGFFIIRPHDTKQEAMAYIEQELNAGNLGDGNEFFLIYTDFPMVYVEARKHYSVRMESNQFK